MFGVGGEYKFDKNWGIKAQYEQYHTNSKVGLYDLGMAYQF